MRYFSIAFGTAEVATIAILVGYMLGFAVGAMFSRRWTRRVKNPLALYGWLEVIIGILALAIPALIQYSSQFYWSLFASGNEIPDGGSGFHFALILVFSFLIVAAPTILMGATLPLVIEAAVHRKKVLSRGVPLLYGVNTLGAVFGVLIAGLLLMPRFGLYQCSWFGVAANLIAGIAALLLSRNWNRNNKRNEEEQAVSNEISYPQTSGNQFFPESARLPRAILCIVVTTIGMIAFTLEVAWNRILGQILGGSTIAFASMLASFLLGIALGSFLARPLQKTKSSTWLSLIFCQIAIAIVSVLSFRLALHMPDWCLSFESKFGTWWSVPILSILVLLPVATFSGASYPLAVRLGSVDSKDEAPIAALLYSWNTIGAVLGAIVGGYFLIPLLGFGATIWAASLACFTVAVLVWIARPGSLSAPILLFASVIAATSLLTLGWFIGPKHTPNELFLVSPRGMDWGVADKPKLYFAKTGHSSNVAVLKRTGVNRLTTNGLPEAIFEEKGLIEHVYSGIKWMGILPFLTKPNAENALVIGLGSGGIVNAIPSRITEIDVIELEQQVVEANRIMAERRLNDPLTDPRVNVVVNDVRGALMGTTKKWDGIISQPSHPWTSGSSHLYTKDFFELVSNHLNDDGIFVQWMGADYVDYELMRSLTATIHDVFGHAEVYRLSNIFVFVASHSHLQIPSQLAASYTGDNRDISSLSEWQAVTLVEDVALALMLDEETTAQFVQSADIITDEENQLAFRSAIAMKQGGLSRDNLIQTHFQDIDHLGKSGNWQPGYWQYRLDPVYLMRNLSSIQVSPWRVEKVKAALPESKRSIWELVEKAENHQMEGIRQLLAEVESNPEIPDYLDFYKSYIELYPLNFRSDRPGLYKWPLLFQRHQPEMEQAFLDASESLSEKEKLIMEIVFFETLKRWQDIVERDQLIAETLHTSDPYYGYIQGVRVLALLNTPNEKEELEKQARKALSILEEMNTAGYRLVFTSHLRFKTAKFLGDIQIMKQVLWTLINHHQGFAKRPDLKESATAIANLTGTLILELESDLKSNPNAEMEAMLASIYESGLVKK